MDGGVQRPTTAVGPPKSKRKTKAKNSVLFCFVLFCFGTELGHLHIYEQFVIIIIIGHINMPQQTMNKRDCQIKVTLFGFDGQNFI